MIALFIFYSKASGAQAALAFSKEFRHCNIITFDGDTWLMIDFDRTGLVTRKINCKSGAQLLRLLPINKDISAVLAVQVRERAKVRWKPFWVRSCNEVCRYVSGVKIGFTFNPIHLYQKLLRYKGRRNYEVLHAWRRDNGTIRRRRRAQRFREIDGGAVQPQSTGAGTQESEFIPD